MSEQGEKLQNPTEFCRRTWWDNTSQGSFHTYCLPLKTQEPGRFTTCWQTTILKRFNTRWQPFIENRPLLLKDPNAQEHREIGKRLTWSKCRLIQEQQSRSWFFMPLWNWSTELFSNINILYLTMEKQPWCRVCAWRKCWVQLRFYPSQSFGSVKDICLNNKK